MSPDQGLRLYLLYTSTSTSTSPYKLDKYRCLQVQATQALWACFIQVQVAKTVVQSLYKFFWPTSTVTELVHKLHKLCTPQMIQYNRFQLFIQRVLLGSFLWRTGHLTDNQRLFLLFKWIKDTPDKSQNIIILNQKYTSKFYKISNFRVQTSSGTRSAPYQNN